MLIDQLIEFPKGSNDDLPDALAYAVSEFENLTGSVKVINSIWNSPYFDINY